MHQNSSNPSSRSGTPTQQQRTATPTTISKEDHRVIKAIQDIRKIVDDLPELERQAAAFVGRKTDKPYLVIEDQLTKKLLQLDGIAPPDVAGGDQVRVQRKTAVRSVQAVITALEQKAADQ